MFLFFLRRHLVDQFVLGANMVKHDDMRPLREWVGALRLIRIVERETEADFCPKKIK